MLDQICCRTTEVHNPPENCQTTANTPCFELVEMGKKEECGKYKRAFSFLSPFGNKTKKGGKYHILFWFLHKPGRLLH